MAPSGLDSIALAVAHLERAEKASLSVADDSSSPTASEFSKTGLPTSLFLNHTRVVSTDGLDAKAPSSSSPVASQSPHLPPPPPSSSLAYYSPSPLMENRQWNHISAFVPSLSVTAATTTHGFALPTPSTFTLPSHAPPQTLHSVLRRCSSPSSANNNSNNNKKTSTPHQKPLKNLSLLFEMAPYPIPKDIATTTNTTTTTTTSDIRDDDVLCGRGGETNHHRGNIQYRHLVKACQPAYLAAKRRDKPRIAAGIVLAVRRAGGRFLKKQDDTTDIWVDVGNVRAREKTSQALREGAPDLRPKTL